MRLLLTTDTIGGVWTFTQELTEGLVRRGHAVALVSLGRMPSPSQQAWCDALSAEHAGEFFYAPLAAPLEWMEANANAYSAGEPALLRIAEAFGAELLHANQYCFGALPLSIPKVLTAHSDVLSWAEACRPQGLPDSAWLRTYSTLVQAGLNGATALTAPTRWMAEALQQNFSVPSEVRVIANGRHLAKNSKPTGRKLQAISAGRLWDEAKGLELLTELNAAMPVLLAGEAALSSEAEGMLSEQELLRLFQESSVYVAASRYEPFGLAPLEAALCGCAVVARDIASLREVWGDAAMFFRDRKSLHAILKRLAQNTEALADAQRMSLRRAREYTAERMVDAYTKLYGGVMERPGNVPQERTVHAG